MKRRFSLLAFVCLSLHSLTSGQAPERISFQGRLESAGLAVTDTLDLDFMMYDSTGSTIWSETHADVEVHDGVFSVILGNTSSTSSLTFDHGYELGVTVATDPEISPKVELSSVPYALSLRHLRVFSEPANSGPIMLGGSHFNGFSGESWGSTIAGGGGPGFINIYFDCGNHPGGNQNWVSGSYSTIGGGYRNYSCTGSTVAGGGNNHAKGPFTTVSGGSNNTTQGSYSVVPGGTYNDATGRYSFAAGIGAKALHSGTFVWADSTSSGGGFGPGFVSTARNQFLIGAAGGVGIGTNSPSNQLTVKGAAGFDSLAIGKSTPATKLDVQGGNWNLATTEGDFRIGNDTYRLKFGIAMGGGGAGRAGIDRKSVV